MKIGTFDLQKITAQGAAHLAILDDDGQRLTTPDVVLTISLPDPGPEPEGPPELTDSGLTYGTASLTLAEIEAALTEAYAHQIANPPPTPVPASVKAWRLRAVAKLTGLWNDIEAVIAALPTDQQTVAREAFNDSEIERLHPLTLLIFAQLGKTATEADDIFRAAASLA